MLPSKDGSNNVAKAIFFRERYNKNCFRSVICYFYAIRYINVKSLQLSKLL